MPHPSTAFGKTHGHPKGELRLLGIDFAPSPTEDERIADLTALKDATSGWGLDPSQLPPARKPARPVFSDETGAHFTYEPDSMGQWSPVPISKSPEIDLKQGVPETGGFVPQAKLDGMTPSYSKPSPTDIIAAAMMQKILRAALSSNRAQDGPPSTGNPILDRLKGIAISQLEQKAAGMLAGGIIDGSVLGGLNFPSLGDLANGLKGIGINQALDFGAEAILSKFFAVDDTSDSGEFLAAEAAKKLMDELKSVAAEYVGKKIGLASGPEGDSLSAQINDVLGTPKPGMPLARTGDYTQHRGTVIGGTTRTVVGGVAIARATDEQVCPKPGPPPHKGGKIRQGNDTVIIEGLPAARYMHEAICDGCSGITALEPLMMDVEIGLQTMDVLPPPVPPVQSIGAPAAAAAAGGAGSGSPGAGGKPSDKAEQAKQKVPEPADDSEPPPPDQPPSKEDNSPESHATGEDPNSSLKNAATPEEAILAALKQNGGNVQDAIRDIMKARNEYYDQQLVEMRKTRPDLTSSDLTNDEVRNLHSTALTYADAFLQSASGAMLAGNPLELGINLMYASYKFLSSQFGVLGATDSGASSIDNRLRRQSPWNLNYLIYANAGAEWAIQNGDAGYLPSGSAIMGLLNAIKHNRQGETAKP